MDFYRSSAGVDIPILDTEKHEHGETADAFHPRGVAFGYVERDYNLYPEPMFSPPSEMEIIDPSEWDARFDEQEATKSSLEHVYLSGLNGTPAFDALDQNGHGDCWEFSVGGSMMIDRLLQGLPIVRFNPHAGAVILNQLNGGWCGLSAQQARDLGMAEEGNGPGQWPGHSRDRKHITPELRARMGRYRITEDFCDLTRQVYDQNLTEKQVATCGFNNIVGPRDYNFWSHSVTGLRWVRISRGNWGQLILNSWTKGWGRFGLAVLEGTKRICNGGLAIRQTSA